MLLSYILGCGLFRWRLQYPILVPIIWSHVISSKGIISTTPYTLQESSLYLWRPHCLLVKDQAGWTKISEMLSGVLSVKANESESKVSLFLLNLY